MSASSLETAKYQVTEGVLGYWVYHLSHAGKHTVSLCGSRTMTTSLPIEKFGVGKAAPDRAGINGRWCEECKRLAAIGA